MRQRDPVGRRRGGGVQLVRLAVEERPDVAILDRAAEEIAPLDHQLGAEDGPIAGREDRADGAGEAHFVAGERAAGGHPQRVARPEPPHRQGARVGGRLDGQAAIRRRRRFGLRLEGGALEELGQRRLEKAVVLGTDGERWRQCGHRSDGRRASKHPDRHPYCALRRAFQCRPGRIRRALVICCPCWRRCGTLLGLEFS